MTQEERELAIPYLEDIKESYVEGSGCDQHPLPEYYAIEIAIKAINKCSKIEEIIGDWDGVPWGTTSAILQATLLRIEDVLVKDKE